MAFGCFDDEKTEAKEEEPKQSEFSIFAQKTLQESKQTPPLKNHVRLNRRDRFVVEMNPEEARRQAREKRMEGRLLLQKTIQDITDKRKV